MKTIQLSIYKFDELSETAKQKAISEHRSTGTCGEFAWDDLKEDAKQIGLKITSLDDRRANEGEFIISAQETRKLILENHGKQCETYKTALKFLSECEELQKRAEREEKDGDEEYWFAEEIEELENEFLRELLEDYRIIF